MKSLVLSFLLISSFGLSAKHIEFETKFNRALNLSKQENKILFVDFTAAWCGPCQKMEAEVFADSEVADFFNNNFINLQLDDKHNRTIMKNYGVKAYPTLMFLSPEKEIIFKSSGSMNKKTLLNMAENIHYFAELKQEPVDNDTKAEILDGLSNIARTMHIKHFSNLVSNLVSFMPNYKKEILENFGSYISIDKKLEKSIKKNGQDLWSNKKVRDQLAISYLIESQVPQLKDIKDACDKIEKLKFENIDETKIYLTAFYAQNLNIFGDSKKSDVLKLNYGKNLIFKYPYCTDKQTLLNAYKFVLKKEGQTDKIHNDLVTKFNDINPSMWDHYMFDIYANSLLKLDKKEEAKKALDMAILMAEENEIEYVPTQELQALLK